jgi:hypothetical protein
MSKFFQDIFEQKLRIYQFELNDKQKNEFNKFIDSHRLNGSNKGSIFFNLRSKIKEKHFKEYLAIIIKSIIESYSEPNIIDKADVIKLDNLFLSYANHFIEQEKSGLQSVFASQGYQLDSSLVKDNVKAYENRLYSIVSFSKDILHSTIQEHNEKIKFINTDIQSNLEVKTKTDKMLFNLENNKVISIIIVIGIFIIAVGNITNSFTNIRTFLFPNSSSIIKNELLFAHIKITNRLRNNFELHPLCEYKIAESTGAIMKILSHGRIHLTSQLNDTITNFLIKPKETKDVYAIFPDTKMNSLLLDQGTANIYFIFNSLDLRNYYMCFAPFERTSLRNYFIECTIDSTTLYDQ